MNIIPTPKKFIEDEQACAFELTVGSCARFEKHTELLKKTAGKVLETEFSTGKTVFILNMIKISMPELIKSKRKTANLKS